MPYYDYVSKDKQGNIKNGEIFASTAEEIADKLTAENLIPVSIKESKKKRGPKKKFTFDLSFLQKKAAIEDIILFARQMGSMLKAGVPIVNCVKIALSSSNNKSFQNILREILNNLQGGHSFSKSIKKHENTFPSIFISMVEMGESTGNLDEVLIQVVGYLEKDKETKRKVKAALRYPSFVGYAIIGATGIANVFVIPNFANLFKGFGAELPLATRMLLTSSNFTKDYWAYMIVGFMVTMFSFKYYKNTAAGRYAYDRFKLKLPIFGSLIRRSTLGRFSRCFAMMFNAGVPLLNTLGICSKVVDNDFIGKKILEMRTDIERGESMSHAAKNTKLFTPLIIQMIIIGEETGEVHKMLSEVARQYDEEVEYELDRLSSSIEPIMICVMAGMVLILLLGIFLPMWDLATVAS